MWNVDQHENLSNLATPVKIGKIGKAGAIDHRGVSADSRGRIEHRPSTPDDVT